MNTASTFLATALGTSLLLASVGGNAGSRLDQEEARRLVEGGKILPLARILEIHGDRVQGRLLDLELEYEDGRLVYEMEIMGNDGIVRELEIDAASGVLIKQEIED